MSTPAPLRIDLDLLSVAIYDAIDNHTPGFWDVDDVFDDIVGAVAYEVRDGLIRAGDTDNYGDQPIGAPVVCLSPDTDLPDIIEDIISDLDADELAGSYDSPYRTSDLEDLYDTYSGEVTDWAVAYLDLGETAMIYGLGGIVEQATIGWLESVAYDVALEIVGKIAGDLADDIAAEITA